MYLARYLFFRTSRSSYQQVTELFDFIWSTAAALWNLRWQVRGLANDLPGATNEILHGRFVAGSGVHSANLRRTCIEMSWDEQQEQFAKFLLVDLFAIYEGWLARTLTDIGQASLVKQFQFPTTLQSNGSKKGVGRALLQVHHSPSPILRPAFYNKLIGHPKNSLQKIENLLVAYRCFKECRNTLMHNEGKADAKCVAAYQAYASLSPGDLGAPELPKVNQPVVGQRVTLPLRGVVGFSDVILRLIATLDAELSCVQAAEKEIIAQWQEHFSVPGRPKKPRPVLSPNATRHNDQVRRLIGKLGLPKPIQTHPLEVYLRAHRLII